MSETGGISICSSNCTCITPTQPIYDFIHQPTDLFEYDLFIILVMRTHITSIRMAIQINFPGCILDFLMYRMCNREAKNSRGFSENGKTQYEERRVVARAR